MGSKTRINSVVLFLLLFGVLIPFESSAQTTFEQLRSRFDEGQIFKAQFSHTYLDSYTEESTTSDGQIWINAVGYRLESEPQVIVVDGTLSQVYDGSRNRVIISDYEADEDDFAPSRMLSGIDETYTSSESDLENGNVLITLETDDDFAAFITVEIEVDANFIPIKITAYDIADNIISTIFESGEFIAEDESVFEFTHPEDAEIVDMRY